MVAILSVTKIDSGEINRLPLKKWMPKIGLPKLLIGSCCQKLSIRDNFWKNGRLQLLRFKNEPIWKSGRLKPNLLVWLRKWIADCYFFLQIKWHTTLKNGQLKVVGLDKLLSRYYRPLQISTIHFFLKKQYC